MWRDHTALEPKFHQPKFLGFRLAPRPPKILKLQPMVVQGDTLNYQ